MPCTQERICAKTKTTDGMFTIDQNKILRFAIANVPIGAFLTGIVRATPVPH